jgi:hypothetical protein
VVSEEGRSLLTETRIMAYATHCSPVKFWLLFGTLLTSL